MKKKLIAIVIAILLILTNAITIYGNTSNTVTATVEENKTEVKVGESFTVVLKALSANGIVAVNGFSYSYDEEKLEIVSENVVTGFTKYVEEGVTTLMYTGEEITNNVDMYTVTFSVKDGVEADSTAIVSFGEMILVDLNTTEYIVPSQSITVTVIEDDETGDEGEGQPPADEGNGEGEENPPADEGNGEGEENPPADEGNGEGEENPPADEGNGEGEENPPADEGNGEGEENPPADEGSGEGEENPPANDEKDDTTADKEIPKAGLNTMIVIGIVAIIIVAVVMYRKKQEYQDII